MKANLFVTSFLVTLAATVLSCKNSSQSGSAASGEVMDLSYVDEPAAEEVIGYPIPTSFEVVSLLNNAGAPFIIGINNPTDNVSNYVSTRDKAVNLGIYGADLSYASTYNFQQETRDYLRVSKQLIDELQIASAFNRDFAQRVEDNIENKDSLISIITRSFYDTYAYLQENDQDVNSALVVAGSWIESVYLTSQIIITSQDKAPFVSILVNQGSSLSELMKVLEPVKDDPAVKDIYAKLFEIEKSYAGIGNQATQDQINTLTARIEELRSGLV